MRADGRAGPKPASDVAGEIAEARTEPDAGGGASSAELRARYEQALARVEELHRRLREADRTLREPADLGVDTDVDASPEAPRPRTPPMAAEPEARTDAAGRGVPPDTPQHARLNETPVPDHPDEAPVQLVPEPPSATPVPDHPDEAPVQLVPEPPSATPVRGKPGEAPVQLAPEPPSAPVALRPDPPVVTAATLPPAAQPEDGEVARARGWQWAGVAGASLVVVVIAASVLFPGPRQGAARDATASDTRSSAEGVAPLPTDGGAFEETGAEEEPAATSPAPEANRPDEWDLVRHENAGAGYSFSYPEPWTLAEDAEVTTVSSPDGRYVVSFALGPRGPLDQTYDSFVALLESSYSDVSVTSRKSVAATDGEALLIGGNAVNASGTRVVFRALLLAASSQRPTIGAIAATDSAGAFDERLVEVLTSVEAT